MTALTSGGSGAASGEGGAATTETANPQAPLTEFVEGGDGDDRIAMAGNVAATGGRGADTFVLALPVASHGAPVLLGVVGDFKAAEGDKLELNGKAVVVVDRTEGDLLAVVRAHPGSGDAPVMTGRHIGYDVDGDGKEDAYVLVTGAGGGWFTAAGHGSVPAGAAPVVPGAVTSVPPLEAPHAPIGITAESPHPLPGAEFLF
jgi:hypothetical protein